ncbi:DUF7343 domain-containing protein [Geoglobus acetivorans]|uniref:Transcriptional regulator n=1 Tax=Geoglobus acetivorans TaxID=565033 RepID=A0ABZ3H487_GEOAI|nr:hypothetical protein [Geoglobus acetivorans]
MFEEMVVEILKGRKFDGALQTELVEITGASKSRISEILTKLEKEGRIVRKKETGKNYRVWLREYSESRIKVGILRATEYVKLISAGDYEFIVYSNALELTRDLALGRIEFAASPIITQVMLGITMKSFKIAGIVAENGSGVVFGDKTNGVFATTEMSAMEMNLRAIRNRLGVREFKYCDSAECLVSSLESVNGSAIWEPYFTIAERHKIPFSEMAGDFPCCSLAVNLSFLKESEEDVEMFIRNTRKVVSNYEKASRVLGFDEDVVKKTVKSYKFNPDYSVEEICRIIGKSGFEISKKSLESVFIEI